MVVKKSLRPKWRAPTWSWASMDGQVTCIESQAEDWNACIVVLDACTTPSGPDPYGAVADGDLTVSCTHLVRVHINTDENVGVLADDLLRTQLGTKKLPRHNWLSRGSIISDLRRASPAASRRTRNGGLYKDLWSRPRQACDAWPHPPGFQRLRRIKALSEIGSFNFNKETNCARDKDIYQAFMDVLSQEGHSVVATDLV